MTAMDTTAIEIAAVMETEPINTYNCCRCREGRDRNGDAIFCFCDVDHCNRDGYSHKGDSRSRNRDDHDSNGDRHGRNVEV